VKAIVKNITDFEYSIIRPEVAIQEYESYLQYYFSLDKLRELRTKKALKKLTSTDDEEESSPIHDPSDGERFHGKKQKKIRFDKKARLSHIRKVSHVFISHIHYVFQRACRRFPYYMTFWESHIAFLKSKESYDLLDQIYGKVLALFPKKIQFWISVAMYELENKQNFHASRIFLQRALRVNNKNKELWLKYYELEVWNVLRMIEQYRILHSSPSSSSSAAAENKPLMIDQETRNKLENTLLIVFKHACSSLYPFSGRSNVNEKIDFLEVDGNDEQHQKKNKEKDGNIENEDDEEEMETMMDDSEDEAEDQQQLMIQLDQEEEDAGRSLSAEEKKENLLVLFQMFSLSCDLFSFFPNFLEKMKNLLISIDSFNHQIWIFLFQSNLQQTVRNKIIPLLQLEPSKISEEQAKEEKETKSKKEKVSAIHKNDHLIEEILLLVKTSEQFIQENQNFPSLINERNVTFEIQLVFSVIFVLLSVVSRSSNGSKLDEAKEEDNNNAGREDSKIAVVQLLLSRLSKCEEKFNDFSLFEEFSVKDYHFYDLFQSHSSLSKKFLTSYEVTLNNVFSFFQTSLSSSLSAGASSSFSTSSFDVTSVTRNLPFLISSLHQHRALVKILFLSDMLSLEMNSDATASSKKKDTKKNKSTPSISSPFQTSLSFVSSTIMKDCLLKIINSIEKNGNIEFQSLLANGSFHDLMNTFSEFCYFLLTTSPSSSSSVNHNKKVNNGFSSFFADHKKEFQSLSLLLSLTSSSKQLLLSLFSFYEDYVSGSSLSSAVVTDNKNITDAESDNEDDDRSKEVTSGSNWNEETCRLIISNVHIVSSEVRREFLFFYMNSLFVDCLQLIQKNDSRYVNKKIEGFFDWIFYQFRSFPQFFSFSLMQEFFFAFLEKFQAFRQLLDKENSQKNGNIASKRKLTLQPVKQVTLSENDELYFKLLKKANELNLLSNVSDDEHEESISKCLNQLIEFYRIKGNTTIVNHLQNKRRKLH
jgi:hypothetical protein